MRIEFNPWLWLDWERRIPHGVPAGMRANWMREMLKALVVTLPYEADLKGFDAVSVELADSANNSNMDLRGVFGSEAAKRICYFSMAWSGDRFVFSIQTTYAVIENQPSGRTCILDHGLSLSSALLQIQHLRADDPDTDFAVVRCGEEGFLSYEW